VIASSPQVIDMLRKLLLCAAAVAAVSATSAAVALASMPAVARGSQMLMGNPFRLLAALAWTCDASTLLVPAYWWAATDSSGACTTADFHALAAAGGAAVAVVNPNNGPIDSSDANFAAFAACVAALGDARAIGYVYTKIAEETSPGVWEQRAFRDAGDVEADLDAWAASGLVEGVFLDEVSNSWAASSSGWADDATTAADHEAYYAEIFAAARSRFSFVVANPGSPYPLSYLEDANAPDVVVLSEAAYAKWAPSAAGGTCTDQLWTDAQGSFDEGPFCTYVPNWDGVDGLKDVVDARSSSTAQATLLYDADPALDAAAFVAAAYDAGVDYVYVTDRPVATPWDELPTFWDALVAAATGGDDEDEDDYVASATCENDETWTTPKGVDCGERTSKKKCKKQTGCKWKKKACTDDKAKSCSDLFKKYDKKQEQGKMKKKDEKKVSKLCDKKKNAANIKASAACRRSCGSCPAETASPTASPTPTTGSPTAPRRAATPSPGTGKTPRRRPARGSRGSRRSGAARRARPARGP